MPLLERAIPTLPVHDIELSLAFYADKLGFAVPHKEETFAILRRDAIELHLTRLNDHAWKSRSDFHRRPVVTGAESFLAGTGSCRLEVIDVDVLYAELQQSGALSPRSQLRDQPWNQRDFTVFDPDGNAITFSSKR